MRIALHSVSDGLRRDRRNDQPRSHSASVLAAVLILASQFARTVQAQDAAARANEPPSAAGSPNAATPAASPTISTAGAATTAPVSEAPAAPAAGVDKGTDTFDLGQELSQGAEALSADQVAEMAVKTGPSMAKAEAAAEQAREAASQAYVAVYPRLDLLAQYTRLSPPPPLSFQFTATNPAGGPPMVQNIKVTPGLVDLYTLQARISYPVSDLFFKILPRYKAAQENVKAQELTAHAQAQTVALSAREAYYNYARARATLLVQRSALSQAEAQLRDVESLVHAGTQARVEQMRAEAQVASARVGLARAEGAVAVARTALRSLLHRDGSQEIAVTEDFSQTLSPLTENKDQLLAVAIQNRSEMRSLETMTGVQAHNIQAANADKLPKLSVAANGEFSDPNQRATSYQSKFRGTWALVGMLTWSPNDFAVADAAAGQVEAARAQTLADMAALEDALRNEVSRAYEDYQAARQAMEAALTGIRAAEESYRVRREQFRAGAAVATDVIIAESDLSRSRLDLVNASIDLRIARARLDRAVERGKIG